MISTECGFHHDCRFFKTYQYSQSQTNRSLIDHYCRGTAMDACRIRRYFLALDAGAENHLNTL